MADFGAQMVDGKYHILPIAPAQKYPGEYSVKGWRNMSKWDRYALRQPTSLELTHWGKWPGAGIGMPCGRSVAAIDIDLQSASDAYRAKSLTEKLLGSTPAHRIGEPPKILLVYRVTQEITSKSFGKFDILGLGRQFVCYGIHPSTQKPYDWPVEGIADLALEDLPLVTPAQVERLCMELAKNFPDSCDPPPMRPAHTSSQSGTSLLRADYLDVKSAMTSIPNPDLPYSEWVRIGMALKGALGDQGEDLFLSWSQRSPKNNPEATATAWRSFKPERVGAGTIFFTARSHGWIRPLTDYSRHPGRKFFKEFNTND